MESDDKPSTETEAKPLDTLVEHEKELEAADVTQSESPANLPLASEPGQPSGEGTVIEPEGSDLFERAKAMLEGPGGDIGTEIDIAGVNYLEKLPMLGIAVDALGRLWAVDHHAEKLRLVGRVSK